jgi:hypothetical protein
MRSNSFAGTTAPRETRRHYHTDFPIQSCDERAFGARCTGSNWRLSDESRQTKEQRSEVSARRAENLAASVRQRLVNLSQQRGEEFQFILEFDGNELTRAVKKTFRRRRTEIPKETPIALSEEFIDQPGRQAQWKAFVRKGRLSRETDTLDVVIPKLREFLEPEPVLAAAAENQGLDAIWEPGGPWRSSRRKM